MENGPSYGSPYKRAICEVVYLDWPFSLSDNRLMRLVNNYRSRGFEYIGSDYNDMEHPQAIRFMRPIETVGEPGKESV